MGSQCERKWGLLVPDRIDTAKSSRIAKVNWLKRKKPPHRAQPPVVEVIRVLLLDKLDVLRVNTMPKQAA